MWYWSSPYILDWTFPYYIKYYGYPLLLVVLFFFWYIAMRRWSYKTILILSIVLLLFSLPYILAIPIVIFASGIPEFFRALTIDYPIILGILCVVLSIRGILYAMR